MSRRNVWNAPQVTIEVTDCDPEPTQANNKPKRMPVRIGLGYNNGMANKPRPMQNPNPRRTIGPQYYSQCMLSPRPQSTSRMPLKVVRTPKGGQLVRSGAKPVAAGGLAWLKSVPSKVTAPVDNTLQVPATRKRALKQLDFNKQTATGLGQSDMKSMNSARKDAAANLNPRANNASGEADLRRFALAQSSGRKQKVDTPSFGSDVTKLTFSPEPEITPWRFGRITTKIPLSPMLLLSSRKDPAKQAQANYRRTLQPAACAGSATNSPIATQSGRKRKALPEICDLSDVQEATEMSKLLDISAYVAYQSSFVNNSDVNKTSTGKKLKAADRFEDQDLTYAGQLPCTVTSQATGKKVKAADRFEEQEPTYASQLPCTVTSQAASNVRDYSDQVLALLMELHAHDKQEADIAQQKDDMAHQQADLLKQQADISKKQANLSTKYAELKVKRVLIMEKFLNNYNACTSGNTCGSVRGTPVQATSKPMLVSKTEPVELEPITPSRRRSTRLARLSEMNELDAEDSVSSPVHSALRKETGVTELVPTGVSKCEAGLSSAATETSCLDTTMASPKAPAMPRRSIVSRREAGLSSAATETSFLDTTMASPKAPAMPRRSIVDYEKLRASFPGLMKTPRKTPLKSCKKMPQDLETPDISRRVQASLEMLLDES